MNGDLQARFRNAMAQLASGVSVVTARRADGDPWGLAITSVASYSAAPPSVFFSVAHDARSHDPLIEAEEHGVHLLRLDQGELAQTFAGKDEDKFAAFDWDWDGDVPRLGGVLAYLRCRRAAVFSHGDHSIIVGDVVEARVDAGEPLLYWGRSTGWRLVPPTAG